MSAKVKDHYSSEKFSIAVTSLAIGTGSLQERIANAFVGSLHLLVDHQALAPDIAQRLNEYEAAWRGVPDPGQEGTIAVWARRLSDDEAIEIARWIVDTAWRLHREFWTGE